MVLKLRSRNARKTLKNHANEQVFEAHYVSITPASRVNLVKSLVFYQRVAACNAGDCAILQIIELFAIQRKGPHHQPRAHPFQRYALLFLQA